MTYRMRNLILAIAVAGAGAMLVTFYINNYKKSVQQADETVTVLVAAGDIEPGTSGAEALGLLRRRQVDRSEVVPGAITKVDEIEGMSAVDTVHIGEQVTTRRFRPDVEQGIVGQIRGTQRAVQISGDGNQILIGTLKTGDRVDILTSVEVKLPGGGERTVSRIALRDVLVLRAAETAAPAGQNTRSWVQLAINDRQSQKLFWVIRNSEWSLQLRPVQGAQDSGERVATVGTVLGDGLNDKEYERVFGGPRPTP
jgi:Flp pilus assembly protein CpaB